MSQTKRSSGVLLHVTSLPSRFGIGDLGPAAYRWIELLARHGQTWWQILPLNAPDGTNSPYSAHSAFAGNIYLISPEQLVVDGLLSRRDLPEAAPSARVDFARLKPQRRKLLSLAAERFHAGAGGRSLRAAFDAFKKREAHWLDDFALFMALSDARAGALWTRWPAELVQRRSGAMRDAMHSLDDEIERKRLWQFLFRRQLDALRKHAIAHGIRILGDVPIYVSLDSADVWANQKFFQLDSQRNPIAVAGVPADQFSPTGQRWGNPLYDWTAMRRDGYAWWIARLRAACENADLVRLDHFRGLAGYWSIPAAARSATQGHWVRGPGAPLLKAVREALGGLPLVAEDLGFITPDVERLRDDFELPGMKVLQFAFAKNESQLLPHAHPRNAIAYAGNHDTDTTLGWYRSLDKSSRARLHAYAPEAKRNPLETMLRLTMGSAANTAIFTAQDVLGLGSNARMNTPGAIGTAWTWRISSEQMKATDVWEQLGTLTRIYER